jgi:hypothetical protein
LSYSIKKNQLQEEKEARLNKTPEKEARGKARLIKLFFNRLVLCLLEKPRHMITLTNPGLPAWLPKEGGSITNH